MWLAWFTVAITLIIVEVFTTAFYALWLAIGALVAGLISFVFPDAVWLQVLGAATVSLVLVPLTPKFAERVYGRSPGYKEEKFDIVGKRAVAKTMVGPNGMGIVSVPGSGEWSAMTLSPEIVEPNTEVVVKEMRGTMLVVSAKKEEQNP